MDSDPVTPFIPPFEIPGAPHSAASPIRPNVVPPWSPPAQAHQATPSAQNPYLSPYGTPFIPPMQAQQQPPSSYFMPSVQLPPDGAPPPLQPAHSQGPPGAYPQQQAPPGAYPQQQAPPGAFPPGAYPQHPPPPPGFSADWTGFPPGGPPPGPQFTPYAAPQAPPPWAQTPGYATGYMYQSPLPAAYPPNPYGASWAPPYQTPLQPPYATPGTPYGTYATPPWMPAGMPPQQATAARPRLPDRMQRSDRVDKLNPFAAGPNYGPVLTPMLVKAVGAALRVNPLLMPPTDDDRAHLKWNMLFSTAHCQRSTDPSHRSWSAGRSEPATFPRVSSLTLVSRTLPWLMPITASNPAVGVTCGDIIEQLSEFLQRRLRKEDYEGAQGERRRLIRTAYHHNRSRSSGVPGGQLGDGLKRLDWLGTQTMWGGVQRSESFVGDRFAVVIPCTLELVCFDRPMMSEEEVEEERRARRRDERRRQSMSRSRPTSRPPSRADGNNSSS